MKKWIIKECKSSYNSSEISKFFNLSPEIAKILINRDIVEYDKIRDFLDPKLNNLHQPDLMKDLHKGAKRVLQAIEKNETVAIHGDYDVDGITATALLFDLLKKIGANAIAFIPNRFEDGYGLNVRAIEELKEKGANLIITLDCGISSFAACDRARELGIDLIITDHHEPKDVLPSAYAIINPKQVDCTFPDKKLAGVGISFYFGAVIRNLAEKSSFLNSIKIDIKEYLDLVTLGTVADVADVLGLNRIIIKKGLPLIEISKRVGISALIEVAGLSGKKIGYGNVAFHLAPRLNASGRLSSANKALSLLTTNNQDEANNLAKELDAENRERQKIEEKTLKDAISKIGAIADFDSKKTIVLGSSDWHPGVIGIVASRLVEKYAKPTMLFSFKDGIGKGSGRSMGLFHLSTALSESAHLLKSFGGHKQAAGATIITDNFDKFVLHFEEIGKSKLQDEDLIPKLYIDAEINFSQITPKLLLDLKLLEPFGPGNPQPLFMTKEVVIKEKKHINGKHLRLLLSHDSKNIFAIAFNHSNIDAEKNDKIDIAYFPKINHYNGLDSIELEIKDLYAQNISS